MQFDSDGVISPFETKVKPELAYRVSLGKRKEFLLAPGISTNLIDNDKHRLNLTANYYISNYKADKFDIDEVKYDLQDLAPGKQEIEYFKNWELGKKRNIEEGKLDGNNGSIRSVGHPTGALYGENVVSYAMNKAYDYLINNSGSAGKKIEEIVKRIRSGKVASLEDITYLSSKQSQEQLISLKDKFHDMYYTFLKDALLELGVTPRNREVSSYHLTQYIPTNSLDYILPQQQNTKEVKVQERSAITEGESENSNKFGELEYLFPQQNLKGVVDIISKNKFINSINEVTQVQKEMDKELEKIIDYYNKKGKKAFILNIQPKKGFGLIFKGEIHKEAKKILDTINNKENNEKIKNALDETNKFIQELEEDVKHSDKYNSKEKKEITKSVEELKERIKEIESGLKLIPKDLKIIDIILKIIKDPINSIPTLINMVKNFKDPKTRLLDPLNNIVGIKGTKMVKDATDIIFEPENVPNFDMLLGLNIVKSEHDAVKYDYEKKMLEELNKPKYAVHNGGVGQGLNINLRYDNKVKPIYLNTNVDMLHYSNVNNHMNRVALSNELGYTPNKFDFVAKTDLAYKDIMLNDLAYSKLNADIDLSLKFKLRSRNSKWLLRPGIEYVGNYEYVNTKNSVVPVEIFARDKNGNLIDNDGNSVDISKESRYKSKYGKNLKEVFKHQSVTYSKKWLKPTHTIIPSVDLIYTPTKNIDISYGVIVPVKFIGKDFDGIMIKNKVGLGIKF